MNKSIITAATALLLSVSIAAQTNDPVQNKTRIQNKDQNKEQTMTRQQEKLMDQQGNMAQTKAQKKVKKANHGEVVSETAHNTESGAGKGQIVSEQARLRGETQQAKIKNQTSAKNQGANSGARPANAMQQNKIHAAKGSGAGRK